MKDDIKFYLLTSIEKDEFSPSKLTDEELKVFLDECQRKQLWTLQFIEGDTTHIIPSDDGRLLLNYKYIHFAKQGALGFVNMGGLLTGDYRVNPTEYAQQWKQEYKNMQEQKQKPPIIASGHAKVITGNVSNSTVGDVSNSSLANGDIRESELTTFTWIRKHHTKITIGSIALNIVMVLKYILFA